jgi:enediyne polyketide synthase
MAGLIKAALAIRTQILPPTTACNNPLTELASPGSTLTVLDKGRVWPTEQPLRAGVSAMGFGGINTHLVLEGADEKRRVNLTAEERALLSSSQDAELFLFSSEGKDDLLKQTSHRLRFALQLSLAEMGDLSARLERTVRDRGESHGSLMRAAIVASTPSELAGGLELLKSSLIGNLTSKMDLKAGLFLGSASAARVGFLFPGQASPVYFDGGIFSRRFEDIEQLYSQADLQSGDAGKTEVAQPAIVTASIAGLRLMESLGIRAEVAVGHSLGEITALHWAGAFNERTALQIAAARAAAMNSIPGPHGRMANIRASRREVEALLNGDPVVIACLNSPRQVVVSGAASAVARFVDQVQAHGMAATLLPVSHAFHSPLLASAAPLLAAYLSREKFHSLEKRVVSTVSGRPLSDADDLRHLLYQQLVAPVRFEEAVSTPATKWTSSLKSAPVTCYPDSSRVRRQTRLALDSGGRH